MRDGAPVPPPDAATYQAPRRDRSTFEIITTVASKPVGVFKGTLERLEWIDSTTGAVKAVARQAKPRTPLYEIADARGDVLGFVQVSDSIADKNRLYGPLGEERARLGSYAGADSPFLRKPTAQIFTQGGVVVGRVWENRRKRAKYQMEPVSPDPHDQLLLQMYPALRMLWELRTAGHADGYAYRLGIAPF